MDSTLWMEAQGCHLVCSNLKCGYISPCWQKCVTAWQLCRAPRVLGLCIKGQDAVFWNVKPAFMAFSTRKQIVVWCVEAFLNYKVVLEKPLSLLEGTEQSSASSLPTVWSNISIRITVWVCRRFLAPCGLLYLLCDASNRLAFPYRTQGI